MACCRVKCLKDAVMPILWLNCVFCMGIFEIPWHRPRFFFSIVYAVTMATAYFALLYKGIIIFEETFSYNLTMFYCVVTVNILVATCSVILFWRKSQSFSILLKRMGHADDTLEALGMKKNYRKIFRVVVSYVMIWIACMMILNITHMVWMWHDNGYMSNLYTALCFGFPIMLNSVVDVTFASFVRCIKTKFQYTNILINDVVMSANEASILKIHNDLKNTPVAIVGSKYKNDKDRIKHLVQTLMQLHLELTRIAQEINGTYCLQLLLELAVHFTIVTAVCYSLYSVFAGASGVGNEKITAMIIWGAVYSLKIILINNLCTMTSYEAYKTGEIVQTFEGSYLDDELREEIRQFTEQIVLNSLCFTAAGFFKINNALTGSFFATVTTYVVILIQISAPT